MRFLRFSFIGIVLVMYSCGGQVDQADIPDIPPGFDTMKFDAKAKEKYEKARTIFFSIPSPMETTLLLKRAGVAFNPTFLNSIDNLNNYETSDVKALNLGSYLADLSYCNVFKQQEQCLRYFAGLKTLGDDLQLTSVFSVDLVDRVERNLDNRDSILHIISEAYWTTKTELEDDEREKMATYVLTGGWIEGLYLACHLSKEEANDKLTTRIAEQKYSAMNLRALVRLQNDDGSMSNLQDGVEELAELFESLKEIKEPGSYTVDEHGVIKVGKRIRVFISPDELELITAKVTDLRNSFVQ